MDELLRQTAIARVALALVVIAVSMVLKVSDFIDRHFGFAPVEARILVLSETCTLQPVDKGLIMSPHWFDCAGADQVLKTVPAQPAMRLRRDLALRLAYVSPVDGKVHITEHRQEDWSGGPKAVGQTLSILASKTETDRLRSL